MSSAVATAVISATPQVEITAPSPELDVAVPPSQDWDVAVIDAPRYRWAKIRPDEFNNGAVTLSRTSTTTVTYKIPARVWNPSMAIPSGLYTDAKDAALANFQQADTHKLVSIKLQTQSNKVVSDITQAKQYTQVMRPMRTTQKRMLDLPCAGNKAEGFEQTENLERNNALANDDTSKHYLHIAANPMLADQSYTEVKYIRLSAINADLVTLEQPSLGELFPWSFFEQKQDVYFPEEVSLICVYAPANNWSWGATLATDPSTGATVKTAAVSIANAHLFIPYQDNPKLAADLIARTAKGYSKPIPWITCKKQLQSANTAFQIGQKYTRVDGSHLRMVVTAPFAGAETTNTCGDHNNLPSAVAGAQYQKVTTYNTSINSENLQNFAVLCTTPFDDWRMNKLRLKNTPLGSDRRIYQKNWHHADVFTHDAPPPEGREGIDPTNVLGGLPLNEDKIYQFDAQLTRDAATLNQSIQWYQFGVTTKMLHISSAGIDVTS